MQIERREFLSVLGTGAVLLAAGDLASCATATTAQSAAATPTVPVARPNIFFILADDHAFTDSGAAGNTNVQTPNIDRLARESMRLTNYFTASPMCTPARSMLYTGIHPVKIGAYPNHSKAYDNVKSIAQYLKALGYRVGLAGKIHVEPPEVFAFEFLSLAQNAVEEFITRDPAPFCLIFASHHPHAPWGRGVYDPAKLTLHPYLVDTPQTRQALADYYHDVTEFDKEVGMCLNLLDKHKFVDNTLTLCSSDHGAQFPHGKWTCYDFGLKVQFMARWPGKIKPGTTSDALACHADFVPTAIQLAGGIPPPNLDGKSLLPLLTGSNPQKLHDAVFGVHTTRGIIKGSECYPIRSIRTETHKYIWNLKPDATFQNVVTAPRPTDHENYWQSWIEKAKTDPAAQKLVDAYQHRPEEELYDITIDPCELTNLAANPKHADLKTSLRKRLEAFMKQQGDKGIETEMDAKNRQVAGPDRD